MKTSYILKNGRVIDPSRGIDRKMDIGLRDGKIVNPSRIKDAEVIDLKGLVVAPGFIDMHVHLRQPGKTDSETVKTGTRAAAAGGFTKVVAMPNTSPPTDNPGTIELVKRIAKDEGVVKVLLCGCISKNQEGKEMTGIGSLKKAGVVALTDDGKCVQNHELMRHVLEYSKSFGLPILDHCEDEKLGSGGMMHEGTWSVLLGLRGIPAASEEIMVARDIILAEMIDWKIHFQHISTSGSVRMIKDAKKRGVKVTAEVTPHHIALTDEEIKHFDTNYKMNPPLRSEQHRRSLIDGLKDGTITVIATDHAPHTETDKLVEFDYAPFGIVGLETAVSVCMTELYHKKHLTLSKLISKFTVGPAEILGLKTGLAEGSTADITIIDPDLKHKIDASTFFTKSRNTPFDGCEVRGKSMATIVDGNIIYSLLDGIKGMI
ncbi:MAG: dihydroorotase [Victivallales bacterium]